MGVFRLLRGVGEATDGASFASLFLYCCLCALESSLRDKVFLVE